MQSNKKIKGLAVFSKEEQIRERSLRLYIYLICRAKLRNQPNKFGDNIRVFQQKDINLQQIKRILGYDPETTKKYWAGLEEEGLLKFCPHNWIEENFTEDSQLISFNKKWKQRNKHKETYYEIPIKKDQLFRKIPKETLTELNELYGINELTLKIYIVLTNFQEECIYNRYNYMKFTYLDLRSMLDYKSHDDINRKMEASLNFLQSLKLIDIERDTYINSQGLTIPCFCLNQVNFYIDYDFKGFNTGNERIVKEDLIKQTVEKSKKEYPEVFGK